MSLQPTYIVRHLFEKVPLDDVLSYEELRGRVVQAFALEEEAFDLVDESEDVFDAMHFALHAGFAELVQLRVLLRKGEEGEKGEASSSADEDEALDDVQARLVDYLARRPDLLEYVPFMAPAQAAHYELDNEFLVFPVGFFAPEWSEMYDGELGRMKRIQDHKSGLGPSYGDPAFLNSEPWKIVVKLQGAQKTQVAYFRKLVTKATRERNKLAKEAEKRMVKEREKAERAQKKLMAQQEKQDQKQQKREDTASLLQISKELKSMDSRKRKADWEADKQARKDVRLVADGKKEMEAPFSGSYPWFRAVPSGMARDAQGSPLCALQLPPLLLRELLPHVAKLRETHKGKHPVTGEVQYGSVNYNPQSGNSTLDLTKFKFPGYKVQRAIKGFCNGSVCNLALVQESLLGAYVVAASYVDPARLHTKDSVHAWLLWLTEGEDANLSETRVRDWMAGVLPSYAESKETSLREMRSTNRGYKDGGGRSKVDDRKYKQQQALDAFLQGYRHDRKCPPAAWEGAEDMLAAYGTPLDATTGARPAPPLPLPLPPPPGLSEDDVALAMATAEDGFTPDLALRLKRRGATVAQLLPFYQHQEEHLMPTYSAGALHEAGVPAKRLVEMGVATRILLRFLSIDQLVAAGGGSRSHLEVVAQGMGLL